MTPIPNKSARRGIILPLFHFGEFARGERDPSTTLLCPPRALLDALDKPLDERGLLALRSAPARGVLRAFDRFAQVKDDRDSRLGEADATVHGRAGEVLGEQEGGLFREALVVNARLEVLLWRTDGDVEVERAERGRFWFRGRGEG